ncbi:MAG: glycosyltransferase family 39 protein, partial [Acidobacteriota bacterium]|nr:glycosyltransferase family 39 protein [Acidobacteriota bacterium]
MWLSAIYMVEAWRRVTPWLFGDELEFTQLSRAIAATGHPAERGHPHGADSVWSYVISLFWHIHNVATAYDAIKYFDVLVMAAVVFPTYLLARMLVGRTASLFAAAGAGVIPALAYSSYLVQEPIAYPYAALCFFLIANALVKRRRWPVTGAVAASVFAPAVKGELIVVPAVLVLA